MYKYQDFKDNFGGDDIEQKLVKVGCYISSQYEAATESIVRHCSGDSWETLACIDRLVELKLIRCVDDSNSIRNYWVYRKI